MDRDARHNLANLIAALVVVLLLQYWWVESQRIEPVPYRQFEQALAEGRVAEVVITDTEVIGTLKHADPGGRTELVATRVEPDLAARPSRYGVPFRREAGGHWLRDLLSWVVPSLVALAVWMFLFRRVLGRQDPARTSRRGPGGRAVLLDQRFGVRRNVRRRRRCCVPAASIATCSSIDPTAKAGCRSSACT
jgi:cell division protease FtsH